MIEVYVNSIMVKSAKTDHTNQPIGVQEISDLFTDSVFKKTEARKNGGPVNLAPQLCILYYILLYEETLESQRKNLGMFGSDTRSNFLSLTWTATIQAILDVNWEKY